MLLSFRSIELAISFFHTWVVLMRTELVSTMRWCGAFLLATLMLLALTVVASGQQTITSGSLTGRVEDANADAVDGATITVTNLGTNQTVPSRTDHDGRYRFASLPVGDYKLSVTAQGFAVLDTQITV